MAPDKNRLAVPLLDLKAQYESIKREVEPAVLEVMRSQELILGSEVAALENEVAAYCGCKYAVGVSSGSDALLIALMALGVGPGDEVITTTYSFFATAGCIARLNARPVFVDIDPRTYNINPELIAGAITRRTKAILPVHLFGQCADMDAILDIAARNGIPVIEDAAQAIGASYNGHRAGSMGAMGCFSFYPSKNLGAFGDAGMVTTSDAKLYHKLKILRSHGAMEKYYHQYVGGNFRIDAIQAAVLRIKLKYLDKWTEKRRAHADSYNHGFEKAGLIPRKIAVPLCNTERHIYNQYVIYVEDRDQLQAHLKNEAIGTAIYYPLPLHRQQCFVLQSDRIPHLPESDRAARHTLALPVYPELTPAQRTRVTNAIVELLIKGSNLRKAKKSPKAAAKPLKPAKKPAAKKFKSDSANQE